MEKTDEEKRKELTTIVADLVAKYSKGIKVAREDLLTIRARGTYPESILRRFEFDIRSVDRRRRSFRALLKGIPDKEGFELDFLLRIFGKTEGQS